MIVNLDDRCKQQQMGEGWFATIDDVPNSMLGAPKPIDFDYFIEKCDRLLQASAPDSLERSDLWCMANDFRSMKNRNYSFK